MGLVGRKCGMTRVFTDDGVSIPVTVIEAQPNRITQVKTVETDGYRALQVSAGSRKASRVRKPAAGHFAAAKVEAGDLMMEFRLEDTDAGEFEKGNELKVDLFEEGQKVDVIGTTIGNSACRTRRTATRWLTALQALLVRTKHPVASSKVRRWLATWVTFAAPYRISSLYVSTQNEICS
jgi:hypothetical protein